LSFSCASSHFIAMTAFFFSSRRRHTRSKRDWSSDVCSSDLKEDVSIVLGVQGRTYRELYETLERKYKNHNLINDDVLNLKKLELNGYAPDDFIVNGTFDHASCEGIDLNLNKMWDTDYRDVLLYYVENSKNTSLRLQIIA